MGKEERGYAKKNIKTIVTIMLLIMGISGMIQGAGFARNSQSFDPRVFGGFVVLSGALLSIASIFCLSLLKAIETVNGALANYANINKVMVEVMKKHKKNQ